MIRNLHNFFSSKEMSNKFHATIQQPFVVSSLSSRDVEITNITFFLQKFQNRILEGKYYECVSLFFWKCPRTTKVKYLAHEFSSIFHE